MHPEQASSLAAAAPLRTVRIKDRTTALGMAVDYLMNKPAFARLPFGHWSRVLTGQINRGHYFFVLRGTDVVGFAGWALASAEDAEAWLAGRSTPELEKGNAGDCIILNAWDAATPEANRMLLQQIRSIGRDRDWVYARREYPDGRSRPVKLSVNDFVAGHVAPAVRPPDGPAPGRSD
jgi:hemolysin-activating ACP:hemolysin acyltransferase